MINVKERIDYLKLVKMPEITERVKRVKALGNLSENAEYYTAMTEMGKIEIEISDLEYMLERGIESYDETIKSTEEIAEEIKSEKEIFKFFGNDDFVIANKDKIFTVEEEIAIIYHSDSMPLEDKIKALKEREDKVSEELKDDIEDFIADKKRVFEKIKSIDDKDVFFAVAFDNWDGKTYYMYSRTYDAAIEDSKFANVQYIDIIKVSNDDKNDDRNERSDFLGRIRFAKGKKGCSIGNVSLVSNNKEDWRIKAERPLNKIIVEFNNPYKAYDLVKTPYRFPMYVVVADINNPKVKEFMKENSAPERHHNDWIKLSMPTWYIENANYGSVPIGHINLSYGLEFAAFSLSDYKRLDDDMTKAQMDYIAEIKRQVEETDNLSKIPNKK